MENLTPLVVDVEMTTIDGSFTLYDPDIEFISDNAACDFKQWPLFRMLYLSRRKLTAYVP
jgi:hypothetical protein